jgi:hypothetical protein
MTTLDLFNTFCADASYDTWREVVRAIGGLPPANPETWRAIAGGRAPLMKPPAELYAAVGRGAGKSQVAAIIAVAKALAYRRANWFTQRPFVGLFGRDQRQADELMAYVRQLLEHPSLRPLVASDPAKRVIGLKSGVRFEVMPSDPRKVRSRGYICAVVDEAAFLDSDERSVQQDVELLRALRPALGRVKGSLLLVISSKHARKGILFEASKQFGKDDPNVVYVEGATMTFNPTFDRAAIERAYRDDPIAAASEFGTAWRADVAGFITLEALAGVTSTGCVERPPDAAISYRAFVDFAGGSGGDSAALAVAFTDRTTRKETLAAVCEIPPPFSPAVVCAEFAGILRRYAVSTVTADRWGAQFVVEGMLRHGIVVQQSAAAKSDLYLDALPLINSRMVELLDHPKLNRQLLALERSAGGTVDHPPRAHDDVANAAIGALVTGRSARLGAELHISVLGGVSWHERQQEADTIAAQQAELDRLMPPDVRANVDHALAHLITEEPAATIAELSAVWRDLAAAGVLPAWTPEIESRAAQLLKRKAA